MKNRVPRSRVCELAELDTLAAGSRMNFSLAEIAALSRDLLDALDEIERLKAASLMGRYIPMQVTVTPRPDGLFEITGTQFIPEGQ